MRLGIRVGRSRMHAVAVSRRGIQSWYSVDTADTSAEQVAQAFDSVLAQLLESDAGASQGAESVVSITFEVSELLRPDASSRVALVRIAPRAPIDAVHELRRQVDEFDPARIIHVSGGHSSFGDELVPLDTAQLRGIAASAPKGERYVITSVGSYVNTEHELAAGRIISEVAAPRSIDYSHSFYSNTVGIRERTALVNSAVLPGAEAVATTLGLVAGRRTPAARLYVTTNDGGCVPLARLSVNPVHSMYATKATQMVGASELQGVNTGRVLVVSQDSAFLGEVAEGAIVVGPGFRDPKGARLATKAANLAEYSHAAIAREPGYPVVISSEADEAAWQNERHPPRRAEVDLGALGAACSPLVDWVNRVVRVRTDEQFRQALAAAEARVRTRLVSFGAAPSSVRILESRAEAATFRHRSVVALRVRGIAERAAMDLSGVERSS